MLFNLSGKKTVGLRGMILGFQVAHGLAAECLKGHLFFSGDDIMFVSRWFIFWHTWLERNEAVDNVLYKMILSVQGGFQNPMVQTKDHF